MTRMISRMPIRRQRFTGNRQFVDSARALQRRFFRLNCLIAVGVVADYRRFR